MLSPFRSLAVPLVAAGIALGAIPLSQAQCRSGGAGASSGGGRMLSGSMPQRGLSSGILGGSMGSGASLRTNPAQQLVLQAAMQQQMALQTAQQRALAQKQQELLAQRKAALQEKRLQAREKIAAAKEAEAQRVKELNALKEERQLVRELEQP